MNWLLWPAVILILISKGAFAAECPSDIKAVTSEDAQVAVDILTYRVQPLTKCELEVEAQAWILLLQEKATEISNAEIAAIYKKNEIKKAKEVEATLEAVKEAKEDVKEAKEEVKEDADPEQVKEATEEAKELEKKSAQDASVQKAIKDAEIKTKEEGKSIAVSGKTTEAKEDVKTALIKHITGLMTERTQLIDRVNIVLAELKAKGGVTEEYDTYIKAISGIKVDVTDASATLTTITGWLMSAEGDFAGPST